MGGSEFIGLDYGAVKDGFELSGLEVTPELWADLRLIESGARDELNRER